MEICYIWIEKFHDISNQVLNFGGELLFKYNEKEKKLYIYRNDYYVDGFFNINNEGKIKNVTVIVGENGSGKTTFLNALKGLYIDGGILGTIGKNEDTHFYKRILVIKQGKKYTVFFYHTLIEEPREDLSEFEFISYGEQRHNVTKFRNNKLRVNGTESFESTACVFYSNLFDNNFYNLSTMDDRSYYDLSTKGIFNKIENDKNEKTILADVNTNLRMIDLRFTVDLLKDLILKEIQERLIFLKDDKFRNNISFKLPEEIVFDYDYRLYRRNNYDRPIPDEKKLLRYEWDRSNLNKVEKNIYESIESIRSTDLSILAKNTLLLRIVDAYFFSAERNIFFDEDIEQIKIMLEGISDSSLSGKHVIDLINMYKEKVVEIMASKNVEAKKKTVDVGFDEDKFLQLTKTFINFIRYIEKFMMNSSLKFVEVEAHSISSHKVEIAKASYSYGKKNIELLTVPLDSDGINLINEFIEEYKKVNSVSDFIKFRWRNISSGEDALLGMYSRFYSIKSNVKEKDLMIVIDEGEVYFHPEWKRKYLSMLLEYLPDLYSDCDSIQIVIASNSPFLLSDVPNNNVNFLDKYDDYYEQDYLRGKCRVIHGADREQTFASNIHTLLIDNFFMKSTIGEFAKQKINEIINALQPKKTKSTGKKKYKTIKEISKKYPQYKCFDDIEGVINIVGEPILKEKLHDMLDMCKHQGNTKEINKKRLESKIARLNCELDKY